MNILHYANNFRVQMVSYSPKDGDVKFDWSTFLEPIKDFKQNYQYLYALHRLFVDGGGDSGRHS